MLHVKQRIEELYAERFGSPPATAERLTGDGSARLYWRLRASDRDPVVGAFGPEHEENEAFLAFSETFRGLGLPVPEIYARDLAARIWLLEDLGDDTLFDRILEARRAGRESLPDEIVALYRRVLDHLPAFQVEGGKSIDYDLAFPRAAFDRQSILWDLNYFKYHFLKLAHVPFNEAKLERDFGRLARFLLKTDTSHFLYRDFQSRNVMVRDGEPWFIDYQGGRRGALQYDVASLLYDAKADLGESLRAEFLSHYLDALAHHIEVDRGRFEKHYDGYALIRILQAMGAYGYRGFYERKPRFLQSVPGAARNIAILLERGLPTRMPEIERALERIVERWGREVPVAESADRLTVQIGSFRYAGGYPEDTTGHGGGFVFDCRALPNPGREPEYAELNGLDPPVIRFFQGRPETEEFWSRVRDLATAQVEEYVRRRFHALSIQFGCTGGQHRSVYFAERLASHLVEVQPEVKVEVTHRERADWPRHRTREQ